METLGTYVVLALTTAPPLIPNSGLLVAAGVLAATGSLNIALVLLVVAGSAVLGDLLIHWTGRHFSAPVRRWMGRRAGRRALLEWITGQIHRHGVPFVIAMRFLPSGRLIGGLAAGVTRYPARRYLIGAVIAESVWATYSVGLGYLGSAAAGNRFYAAGIGFAVSAVVAGVGAVVQLAARRKVRSRPGGPEAPGAEAPGAGGSGAEAPGVQAPGARGSGVQASGPRGSGVQAPGARGSGAEAPGAGGSGAEAPGAEASGARGSGVQASGARGSAAEAPGAEGSGARGSGARAPGAQVPGSDPPGPEDPVRRLQDRTAGGPAVSRRTVHRHR